MRGAEVTVRARTQRKMGDSRRRSRRRISAMGLTAILQPSSHSRTPSCTPLIVWQPRETGQVPIVCSKGGQPAAASLRRAHFHSHLSCSKTHTSVSNNSLCSPSSSTTGRAAIRSTSDGSDAHCAFKNSALARGPEKEESDGGAANGSRSMPFDPLINRMSPAANGMRSKRGLSASARSSNLNQHLSSRHRTCHREKHCARSEQGCAL